MARRRVRRGSAAQDGRRRVSVELVSGVQRVAPGDRGEQFASDITDDSRQMFVAKVNGQVIAYGRVIESAAGEAAPGTPAGYYLSGVLVAPAWRRRGIATALTRARLRWVFARADEVFYVAGAGNIASLHLHTALGFQEIKTVPQRPVRCWRGRTVAAYPCGGLP